MGVLYLIGAFKITKLVFENTLMHVLCYCRPASDVRGFDSFSHGTSRLAPPRPAVEEIRKETILVDDLLVAPRRHSRPDHLVVIIRGPPGSGKTYVSKLLKVRMILWCVTNLHVGMYQIMSLCLRGSGMLNLFRNGYWHVQCTSDSIINDYSWLEKPVGRMAQNKVFKYDVYNFSFYF